MVECYNKIIKQISELDTLSIPAVDDGTPYIRLDKVGDIFEEYGIVADDIYRKVDDVIERTRNLQDDNH